MVVFSLLDHPEWLRFNCQCDQCRQPHSNQRILDSETVSSGCKLRDAVVEGTDFVGLLIDWLISCHLVSFLIDCTVAWLFDWLNDWLNDWVIDWMIDWMIDWLISWSRVFCFPGTRLQLRWMKGDHDGHIDVSWLKQTGDYAEGHPELFQVMVWTFSFLHFLRFSILYFRVPRCRVSTTKKCRKSLCPCINHSWNTDSLSCTICQRPREQSRSLSKKSSAYPYNAPYTVRYWTFRPSRSL